MTHKKSSTEPAIQQRIRRLEITILLLSISVLLLGIFNLRSVGTVWKIVEILDLISERIDFVCQRVDAVFQIG